MTQFVLPASQNREKKGKSRRKFSLGLMLGARLALGRQGAGRPLIGLRLQWTGQAVV